MATNRCTWCGDDPLYLKYHDLEWGVPLHNDNKLFEFLILEGAQAGLSWITVLKKRQNYRRAFANFNVKKVAKYSDQQITELLQDPGVIRNRAKLFSVVSNAHAYIAIQKEFGSFDKYIWGFVGNKPIQNKYKTLKGMPAFTELSTLISRDLKKRDFKFIGPTIVYAFMQATGMVNDHVTSCFRYREV